jgi:hypothetical protein
MLGSYSSSTQDHPLDINHRRDPAVPVSGPAAGPAATPSKSQGSPTLTLATSSRKGKPFKSPFKHLDHSELFWSEWSFQNLRRFRTCWPKETHRLFSNKCCAGAGPPKHLNEYTLRFRLWVLASIQVMAAEDNIIALVEAADMLRVCLQSTKIKNNNIAGRNDESMSKETRNNNNNDIALIVGGLQPKTITPREQNCRLHVI